MYEVFQFFVRMISLLPLLIAVIVMIMTFHPRATITTNNKKRLATGYDRIVMFIAVVVACTVVYALWEI